MGAFKARFDPKPRFFVQAKSKTSTPDGHDKQTVVKCKDSRATPVVALNSVRLWKVRTKKRDGKKKLKKNI